MQKKLRKTLKCLKGVKIKVLGVPELKKEKMGMFLSVNAGSAHGARLVHLTYTPAKATSKTRHIALVGKGLTFDTGGYSLKPGASMMNMKFDMADLQLYTLLSELQFFFNFQLKFLATLV